MSLRRVLALAACLPTLASAALAQEREKAPRWSRDVMILGGVVVVPDAIGRDVSKTGGDLLIARAQTSPLIGARVELRRGFAGAGATLMSSSRKVEVTSLTGVPFPNHGGSPLFYTADVRVYPVGPFAIGRRVSPYVSVGIAGAVLSIDLDNVGGQELGHVPGRTVALGTRISIKDGMAHLDVQVSRAALRRRGPLGPFSARALVVGLGATY